MNRSIDKPCPECYKSNLLLFVESNKPRQVCSKCFKLLQCEKYRIQMRAERLEKRIQKWLDEQND